MTTGSTRTLLRTLARIGARVRYQDLRNEMAALVREYPELEPDRPAPARPARGTRARQARRSNDHWTAARRQAVSRRMKQYWARRRQSKAASQKKR